MDVAGVIVEVAGIIVVGFISPLEASMPGSGSTVVNPIAGKILRLMASSR